MKKIIFILVIGLILCSAAAAEDNLEFQVTTGYDVRVELGLQYSLNNSIAIRTGIGSNIFSFEGGLVLLYDLMGVWNLTPNSDKLGAEMFFGLMDGNTVFTETGPETMLSSGLAAGFYYKINRNHRLSLKGGGGIPFIISPELTGFDPDFIPNLTLTYGFKF